MVRSVPNVRQSVRCVPATTSTAPASQAAGVFEAMMHDLRAVLRLLDGREEEPSAIILDSRTLQSSRESGGRAGYDGAKRRKGSKAHMAVDTLGHLLALHITPANEQD